MPPSLDPSDIINSLLSYPLISLFHCPLLPRDIADGKAVVCRFCGSSTSHAVSCGYLPQPVWLSGFVLCLHPRPYALELHSSLTMASALAASTAMRFLPRFPNPWPRRARTALPLPPPSPLMWRPLVVTVPGLTVAGNASRSVRPRGSPLGLASCYGSGAPP
jgi:hypothetical protein